MKFAVLFVLLGAVLAWYAYQVPLAIGWFVSWTAVSCFLVGGAYAGLGPRLFGKSSIGRLAWWAVLLLGPFLIAYQLLWHVVRITSREPACHEVAPGVWLGRRPLSSDVPSEVVQIVDLCVEFPGLAKSQTDRRYIAIPTLDAGVSDAKAFWEAVDDVAGDLRPVYIHCASGHGRSAMFAAALLIKRNLAANVDDAEAQLRRSRPGIRLNPRQREFVRRGAAEDYELNRTA